MSDQMENPNHSDRAIGSLLWYGTWMASALMTIAIGADCFEIARDTSGFDLSTSYIAKTGIALLIVLPIARVGLMLMLFLRERDYTYAIISSLVLAIIAMGIIAGL